MIDVGMGYEAASDWLPRFIAAEAMTPSHPLREQAFKDAEQRVIFSFEACVWTENIGSWKSDVEQAREAAGDVIEVLRGCAALIVNGEIGDREAA
jgi:hypothetical protein